MTPMLEVRALEVGYGAGRRIVNGVDLSVGAGEIAVVIGQNGAGKSTLLKGIFAMAPFRRGEIILDGVPASALSTRELLLAGLAYVPQDRSLFPKLTVDENLRLGGFLLRDRGLLDRRIEELRTLFPIIAERRREYAAGLSGGEQRILEIARTLVMDPKVIMLDEPSIGLAPRMVDLVFATARKLAERGAAVLMVEQNVKKALQASDRGYVLELGKVKIADRAAALIDNARVSKLYMGVRAGPGAQARPSSSDR
jgi:branched-chain amino acid transport system ATP-binding protein